MKVVLFDLDDTLFAHSAAVDAGVLSYLADLGWPPREHALARWHELEERHYHRYLGGEIGFLDQRIARITDFAALHDVTVDDPAASYQRYFVEYERAWAACDDARACLDAMPGTRFGVITNGELDYQLPKLEAIGLLGRFEHVVASGTFGVAKPDPGIFAHTVALFGVAPADAAYVGDRFETDAVGASAAGLTGVWVDRSGKATSAQAAAAAASGVHIVRGLAEVPALLA